MNNIFFRQYAAFLMMLFILLVGCHNDNDKQHDQTAQLPPAKVQVFTVQTQEVADQVEIMGTVQASKNAVIAAKISGNISHISVTPGSTVSLGDTLITINAGEISAKLLQAKAQLDQATRNLNREEKLLAQKAATSEAVKALQDAVKIAAANYDEAISMLSYTTIKAPFKGVITRKLVDIGDLATPGKPLLHMENDDTLQVIADVPETMVLNITLGMQMEIEVPTAKQAVRGKISEIAPIADTSTRTVPVKLDIDKNPSLHSGQFARVSLPGRKVETILIPPQSILPLGQMERVFVAKEGKSVLRLVRTGKDYPEGIEILSGLTPGDTLIIPGKTLLTDGQPIEIQQ